MIFTIGKHKVKCGSITQGISDLMGEEKAHIIYSDPPWGPGNIKYWETLNNKMTGQAKPNIEFEKFLNSFFSILNTYAENLVFIEYGIKWVDVIKKYSESHGFKYLNILTQTYKSGSKYLPNHLHIIAKNPAEYVYLMSNEYKNSLKESTGLNMVINAIEPVAQAGKIILDPCCGMGYTARAGLKYDMIFRGNEINLERLNKTKKVLNEDL